ncbi:MAG TPA: Mpo1-like protein [Nevskiaceae bacterium]|nr:Mpo1-like protein [Nevskiaceae bacterium]
MQIKTLYDWLDEYAESHRNPTNKLFHWMCIPLIVFSIAGLLRAIPVGNDWINVTTVVGVLVLIYYAMLSLRLTIGMFFIFLLFYWAVEALHYAAGDLQVPILVAIFVVAWVGQFVGHHIEGARPSFFKDLQFLLIGPLWLLSHIYQRLNWLPRPMAAAAH